MTIDALNARYARTNRKNLPVIVGDEAIGHATTLRGARRVTKRWLTACMMQSPESEREPITDRDVTVRLSLAKHHYRPRRETGMASTWMNFDLWQTGY